MTTRTVGPLLWSPQSEEILAQLGSVTDSFPEITTSTNLFLEAEAMLNALFITKGEEPLYLLNERNSNMIRRVGSQREARVPFVGSNSAGKSTLINTMIGSRLMPTGEGHVTGRCCVLTFATADDAFLSEVSLEQFMKDDLKNSSTISLKGKLESDVMKLVKEKLTRPDDAAKLIDWVRQIVVVGWPIPLLSRGLSFIDLPGTSKTDAKEIQDFLKAVLAVLRAPGMLMIYRNESFADDELACYEFFSEALPKGDAEQDPVICFVKSCFDLESMQVSEMTTDIWKAKANSCFKMLLDRHLLSGTEQLGTDYATTKTFACVSAMEASKTRIRPNQYATEVWHEFTTRISAFFLHLQRSRYSATFNAISDACRNFFRLMDNLRSGRMQRIEAKMEAGVRALQEFARKMASRTLLIAGLFPNFLSAQTKNKVIRKALCQQARNTPLPAFDDLKRTGNEAQALGALKLELDQVIKDQIINPVLVALRDQFQVAIAEELEQLRMDMEQNDLLENAIANVIQLSNISSRMFLYTGAYGEFVNAFLNKLMGRGALTGVLVTLSSPILAVMFLGAAVVAGLDAVVGMFQTIGPDWKEKAMEHILESLPHLAAPHAMVEGSDAAIAVLSDRIRAEMQHEVDMANQAVSRFKIAEAVLPDNRLKFARLETFCWAAELKMQGVYSTPTFERTPKGDLKILSSGATGSVFPAVWNGQQVVVKKPHANQPLAIMLSFFEEVHYNRQLTIAGLPNIIQAVGVWQDPEDEFWTIIYPRCEGTLRDLLVQTHIRNGMSIKNKLHIILQLTAGLAAMHDLGVMHRDIKFDNTLYTTNANGTYNIYITDFGTCTTNSSPDTYIGTKNFMAPEIAARTGESYTFEADVYSLGVMINTIIDDLHIRANAEHTTGTGPMHWVTLYKSAMDSPSDRSKIDQLLVAAKALYNAH